MKIVFYFLILFSANTCFANQSIEGIWKYSGYRYDGHVFPIPDSKLDLRFAFFHNQISILKWIYQGEQGFCESHSTFEVKEGNWLFQKVTWVRPSNNTGCSQHPEMRVGFESVTHFTFENDKLLLELELEGQPFVYILDFLMPVGQDERDL